MPFKDDHSTLNSATYIVQRGIGLIEVLMVVIILAIIAAISTPYFKKLFENRESRKVKYTIMSALRMSKTHSFMHRGDVLLCLADMNNNCHRDAGNQLLVFFDTNNNHLFDTNQDVIIRQDSWDLKHGQVYLRAGARRHYTKFFAGTGQSRGHMGHIKYCPNRLKNEKSYKISFNMQGNITYKPNAIHPTDCP